MRSKKSNIVSTRASILPYSNFWVVERVRMEYRRYDDVHFVY